MRTKVTLVLIFLNVALLFFIFGFEREWRTERATQESRRRVLGPEAANIQSIEIGGARVAEPIRLRRTTDGWALTAPIEWPANPHAVSRIVHELQFLEHETSFSKTDLEANGQSLADYGLAEPSLTVTFSSAPADAPAGAATPPSATTATTSPVTLAIGSATSVGNRLYILSPDGERVHVVNRSLAESLRLTLEQLRSDACFTIPVFEVRSLNLQTATPSNLRVRLRREGSRWSFEAPIVARASKPLTELAINGLNSLRTRTFHGPARTQPELVQRAGLAAPALRITLEGNNRRETLLLGREIGPVDAPAALTDQPATLTPPDVEFYAQMEDRDAVFTVALPTRLVATLRQAQEALREPRLLDLEGRTVTAITLAAPGRPELTLQRLEGAAATGASAAWQVVLPAPGRGPQARPADREAVDRLLQHLELLSVQAGEQDSGFVRDAPSEAELEDWGLKRSARPERVITLTLAPETGSAAAPHQVTLLLGVAAEREGRVYAKLENQPFVYVVAPDILRATPVVPRLYRDRLLRDLPAGARLTGITLTDLDTGSLLFSHSLADGETWEQIFAQQPPERAEALATLRGQLRTLRAQRFVLDNFPSTVVVQGEARSWSFRLDATLSLTGGATPQTTISSLFFSQRAGGGTQFVGSPEFDVVFEAEQPLLDAMWTLTYGARDPGPPTPSAEQTPPANAEPAAEPATEPLVEP